MMNNSENCLTEFSNDVSVTLLFIVINCMLFGMQLTMLFLDPTLVTIIFVLITFGFIILWIYTLKKQLS